MRPPVCRLCGRDFDPREEGGMVSFRPGDETGWRGGVDEDEVEREGPPTGHPPHLEWFCGDHLAGAEELAHLEKSEALARLQAP